MLNFGATMTFSIISALSALILAAPANAEIVCSGSKTCKVAKMPLLDQNHSSFQLGWRTRYGETMLCGPVVATMALNSLVQTVPGVITNSQTHTFMSLPWNSGVEYLAKSMKTDRTNGTTVKAFSSFWTKRAKDFKTNVSASLITNSKTVSANHSSILSQMQAGHIPMIQYGRYTMSCKGMANGTKRCTFLRKGGHIVAAQMINGSEATMHDPNGGIIRRENITGIPGKDAAGSTLVYVLPSNFSAATAYRLENKGDSFRLIENLFGFGGRANRR